MWWQCAYLGCFPNIRSFQDNTVSFKMLAVIKTILSYGPNRPACLCLGGRRASSLGPAIDIISQKNTEKTLDLVLDFDSVHRFFFLGLQKIPLSWKYFEGQIFPLVFICSLLASTSDEQSTKSHVLTSSVYRFHWLFKL